MTPPTEGNGAPLLEVSGIEFGYGSLRVLFGVDLEVRRGEILGLLGTNGAGKSTLLRVLSGLARPWAGTMALDGEDVTGADAEALAAKGLVQVPGGKAVFPDLTITENLQVGGFLLRSDRALRAERVDEVLELFPALRDRLSQRAGSLSGGQQQQLALAKALLLKPKLLCIDELSLGLAPVIIEGLLAVVREINRRGTSLVIVEQSLNIAASLCHRAVFLEKGAVRFEGKPAELLERGDLARAVFVGTD